MDAPVGPSYQVPKSPHRRDDTKRDTVGPSYQILQGPLDDRKGNGVGPSYQVHNTDLEDSIENKFPQVGPCYLPTKRSRDETLIERPQTNSLKLVNVSCGKDTLTFDKYILQLKRTKHKIEPEILILVDQSRSMDSPFAGTGGAPRIQAVKTAVRELVQMLEKEGYPFRVCQFSYSNMEDLQVHNIHSNGCCYTTPSQVLATAVGKKLIHKNSIVLAFTDDKSDDTCENKLVVEGLQVLFFLISVTSFRPLLLPDAPKEQKQRQEEQNRKYRPRGVRGNRSRGGEGNPFDPKSAPGSTFFDSGYFNDDPTDVNSLTNGEIPELKTYTPQTLVSTFKKYLEGYGGDCTEITNPSNDLLCIRTAGVSFKVDPRGTIKLPVNLAVGKHTGLFYKK